MDELFHPSLDGRIRSTDKRSDYHIAVPHGNMRKHDYTWWADTVAQTMRGFLRYWDTFDLDSYEIGHRYFNVVTFGPDNRLLSEVEMRYDYNIAARKLNKYHIAVIDMEQAERELKPVSVKDEEKFYRERDAIMQKNTTVHDIDFLHLTMLLRVVFKHPCLKKVLVTVADPFRGAHAPDNEVTTVIPKRVVESEEDVKLLLRIDTSSLKSKRDCEWVFNRMDDELKRLRSAQCPRTRAYEKALISKMREIAQICLNPAAYEKYYLKEDAEELEGFM